MSSYMNVSWPYSFGNFFYRSIMFVCTIAHGILQAETKFQRINNNSIINVELLLAEMTTFGCCTTVPKIQMIASYRPYKDSISVVVIAKISVYCWRIVETYDVDTTPKVGFVCDMG